MHTKQLAAAALLLTLSGCERSERQNKVDTDDQGRTGERAPRAENPQPTVGPNATDPSRPREGVERAGEAVPLGQSDRDADADFKAARGQKISGEAELNEVKNGVQIIVEVEDAPAGMKAIHVHEKGDCSNVEARSMGMHLAPKGERHGLPGSAEHHLGDLGNITIGSDGKGRLELVVAGANLKQNDPMSFRDRAIVIHEGKDTGAQPDGASGKPLACAVIED